MAWLGTTTSVHEPFTLHSLNHIFGKPYIRRCLFSMIEHLTPSTVFKCLADETRARITLLIAREGELCVCELTCALDEIQPKVSRHLAQLRSCGMLADRRQGQWIYYRLHPDLPDWVHQMLMVILEANTRWIASDSERLVAMRNRPERTSVCG